MRVVVVKGAGGAFDLLHALTERVNTVGVDTSRGSSLCHSASAVIAILVDAVGGGAAIGVVGIASSRGRACGCAQAVAVVGIRVRVLGDACSEADAVTVGVIAVAKTGAGVIVAGEPVKDVITIAAIIGSVLRIIAGDKAAGCIIA